MNAFGVIFIYIIILSIVLHLKEHKRHNSIYIINNHIKVKFNLFIFLIRFILRYKINLFTNN